MSSNNNFIISTASTVATNIVIMVSGLITGSMTAHLLGAVGRGELASIQLYGGLLASIATSGLPAAIIYFTGRHVADPGSYFLTGIAIAMLMAALGAFAGYVAIPYLLSAQTPAIISAAQLYLLFIPLGIVTAFSLASLQGQMKMLLWNLLRGVGTVFWLIPLSYLFFLGDVNAVLFSKIYLFFILIVAIVYIGIVIRSHLGRFQVRSELVKPLWQYAIPTSLATFSQQSNLRLDQIFISVMLPPKLLGLYVVAVSWSAAHSPLVNAVSYGMVPHLTRLQDDALRGLAFSRILRTSLVFNLFFATIVIVITPPAIRFLFGTEFVQAVSVSYMLIIGAVLANVKLVLAEGLRGLGFPTAVLKGELAGLVTSGVLFPVLLKFFGLEGVAVGSVIGYSATIFFLVISSRQITGVTISSSLKPQWQDFVYIFDKLRRYRD